VLNIKRDNKVGGWEGGDVLVEIEVSIEIKAPPEKVWEMLAMDRFPEWADVAEVKTAKYISEVRTPRDKYRVGASAHIVEKRWEYDLNVLESLENEKLRVRSKGKYEITMTYLLKPVDGGTTLTWAAEMEMPWGILGKALSGLFRRTAEKDFKKALEKLKSFVEK
jgi:carbon monoxide dehydrogenase subunit G